MKQKSKGKVVLMALAMCAAAVAATGPQEGSRLNAEGVALVQKGDVSAAIESFKAALDADRHCTEAAHNLGKLLIAGKQYALAQKLLELFVRENPGDAGSFVQLAQATALQDKPSECETAARRLAAIDKSQVSQLALLLSGQRSHECARKVADVSVEFCPDDAEAWYNRGLVLQRMDRPVEAETSYAKAVELKADYVDALVNLGNMQDALGNTDGAISSYEKAYSSSPDNPLALYNLGRMLLLKGKDPERGLDLLQAATRHGGSPGANAARKLLLDLLSKSKKGGAE